MYRSNCFFTVTVYLLFYPSATGFGMELTDAGIYYGEYKGDRRNGTGALQLCNGDHVKGTFVSETRQVVVLTGRVLLMFR